MNPPDRESLGQDLSELPLAEPISRRRLIQRLIGGSLVLAIPGYTAITLGSIPESEVPPQPIRYETFPLHGKNLKVVLSEHGESSWQKYGDVITQAISEADIVIPEYFPPEYNILKSLPVLGEGVSYNDKANALFDHVAEVCINKKKQVLVVDPEHDIASMGVRVDVWSPAFLAYLLGNAAAVEFFARRTWKLKDFETFKGAVKRIAQFDAFSLMVVANLFPLVPLFEAGVNLESDFRHVVSAAILDKAFSTELSGDGATMIIPQGHWEDENGEGIKKYLTNKGERDRRLAAYMFLFGPSYPSLFEARYFKPGNGTGRPDEKLSILPF